MLFSFFPLFLTATEYFVKWNGDNRTICHSMWPCDWRIAVELFKKDDYIQITDKFISTPEQLQTFYNMSKYVLKI